MKSEPEGRKKLCISRDNKESSTSALVTTPLYIEYVLVGISAVSRLERIVVKVALGISLALAIESVAFKLEPGQRERKAFVFFE